MEPLNDSPDPQLARTLQRVNRLAWWLDNCIRLPIVGRRVGLDALVGLVPGVGDAVGALASLYIVAVGARLRLPAGVLLRMTGNVALEAVLGSIPLLGDLFDMGWKANVRNARLLMRHVPRTPADRPRVAALRSDSL